jgi:indolepyruvate ferredoxin oxidoreductase alpha subunit
MSNLIGEGKKGSRHLLMGNEAIARGALEAGVCVAAGYPGTPSSEIIEALGEVSKRRKLYVEWSVNEKVAMEVAAAASFAGLRSLCVMKQNGVNVASDFLLHLAYSGIRAGMVLVPCDDPGALSSANEGESRHFAKQVEIPLLEPGDFQEAKDMIKWAFELSEDLGSLVMVRSVTRLSHASGNVIFGELPEPMATAHFKHSGAFIDPVEGPMTTFPVIWRHSQLQQKLQRAAVGDRVGLLKLGTTWPLPPGLLETYLSRTDQILIVEEVISFLEDNVKILAAELASKIGIKAFFGKKDGAIPMAGELNPDLVVTAMSKILGIKYKSVPESYENRATELADLGAPGRDLTFCPGCPHRASFWTIHNVLQMDQREGFVCGDIGCYGLAMLPCGFETLKSLHAMGSSAGLASGFGKLKMFGMHQPVLATVGDSTFFHAVLPALINAVHHQSDITLVILDNSGTAMTGFQPHPGLPVDVKGDQAPEIDIISVCEAIGAKVKVCDPFDLQHSQQTLFELLEDKRGVKVLVLKQICALSPEKKAKKMYEVEIDEMVCLGENCGCNRLCTRVFKCPGLIWDDRKTVSTIDEVICAGCGVCASICPAGAIGKKEVA